MQYNYEKRIEDFAPRIDAVIKSKKCSLNQALIYAGFSRFLPILDCSEYDKLVRNIMINQSLAWREQIDTEVLNNCRIINGQNIVYDKPAIYCAFHNSSYRLNMLYLLKKKIPVVLVASSDIIEKQSKDIYRSYSKVSDSAIMKIIDANSPTSIRTMLHELEEGHSLFVYLDGNTGTGGMTNDKKNLVEVPILGSTIRARKGVAALSYISGAPMIPMIASRDGDSFPDIEIFEKIMPDRSLSRDEFSNFVTLKIYKDVLEKRLSINAGQWEPWLYLYNFYPKDGIVSVERNYFFFDKRKFDLIRKDDQFFIFEYKSLGAMEVDEDTWEKLRKQTVRKEELRLEVFEDLKDNGVIV